MIIFTFLIFLFSFLLFILFSKVKIIQRNILNKFSSEKLRAQMKQLHPGRDFSYFEKEYLERKIRICLLIVTVGSAAACIGCAGSLIHPRITQMGGIKRDGYEGTEKSVNLYILDSNQKYKVTAYVSPREYENEQILQYFDEAEKIINKEMLGNNSSADSVCRDMNLVREAEDLPIEIEWKREKPLLIDKDGRLDEERIKETLAETGQKGIVTKVVATLKYGNETRDIEYAIKLIMPYENEQDAFMSLVESELENADKAGRTEEEMILPKEIDGKKVIFEEKENSDGILILILAIVSAAAVFRAKDKDLDKEVKLRDDQLKQDYPRIVNQYALYYCAGMHTKTIWKEICDDYRKKRDKEERFVYEEMLKSEAAMRDGVGEAQAYAGFLLSCNTKEYKTFINLVGQAVTKGKRQMSTELEKEAERAQQERVQMARIKGEEAGTKMLIPMFMMLGIVLIIVMVPAFVSFQI